jgi:hypothetical protein
MTSQYKTESHRNAILIVIRWQAAIFGISIFYYVLEYLFNFGIHVTAIRVYFFIGFSSLILIGTYMIVRRFNKYLPLSEHIILSYNLSLKILFIAVTLLIFFMIIPAIHANTLDKYSKFLSLDRFNFAIRSILTSIIFFEAYLRVMPLLAIKHFNFYYAKTLVGNSLYEQKENEVKRIKHLFVGINSYRKFLRNRLDLDIDSVKVYPKITALVPEERNELIKSVYEAFSEDKDKLKPIVCLKTFLNLPAQEVLVKEHTRDKIKQLSLLLIPIITVIISVIKLVIE